MAEEEEGSGEEMKKHPVDSLYDNRVVPAAVRGTACDLPGLYLQCDICHGILINFTIYSSKPMNMCDDCYEKQVKK